MVVGAKLTGPDCVCVPGNAGNSSCTPNTRSLPTVPERGSPGISAASRVGCLGEPKRLARFIFVAQTGERTPFFAQRQLSHVTVVRGTAKSGSMAETGGKRTTDSG